MKELIIIVCRINIDGLSRQQVDESFRNMIEECSLSKDDELKENYIIREIFLPITNEASDVKIIYPIGTKKDWNAEIKDIDDRVKESGDDTSVRMWNKILREIKLLELKLKS
jgi:hypothetical protein